ncbi:Fur family transcriptional regulator [Isoptericola chiayiensis]|uniref:Fur family transcriptional regulator n=1 Tax=Isoptericola chiayiensis TaxID=579446 RepID=A0ABP8Y9R7_9MICO|nr:Fur family transcriptional regulator [Isoptericola chiayiensis]NOW02004.1 Fur family ferric uptake transcriptional regulator [Isoptericola chiayiensis]
MNHAGSTRNATDRARSLRERGLRATAGRVAALAYVDAHPHVTAADVFEALREELPSTSPQAVHNVLADLHRHGLLRRTDLPDSAGAQYETRTGDNHHHVQCVVCGRVEDVDCVVGHAPCLTPSDSHGMRVFVTDVTFRGICRTCEDQTSENPTGPTRLP